MPRFGTTRLDPRFRALHTLVSRPYVPDSRPIKRDKGFSMPIRQRRRSPCLFLDAPEERCNPSPTLIANIPLVQPDSNWNYTQPTNASPLMADLDGDGQQEILAPGGDGNLYAYKFNQATQQIAVSRQFFCGPWAAPIESTPVLAIYSGRLVIFAANVNDIAFAWAAPTGGILPRSPVVSCITHIPPLTSTSP